MSTLGQIFNEKGARVCCSNFDFFSKNSRVDKKKNYLREMRPSLRRACKATLKQPKKVSGPRGRRPSPAKIKSKRKRLAAPGNN